MIRSLLHVGMTVPDLEIGRAFYETFGLQMRSSGKDYVFRCPDRAQDQIRLMQGPKKKLSYVALGTNEAGMEVLLRKLRAADVALQPAPFDVPFGGVWFQDPHGDWLNVQVAEPAPSSQTALPAEINAHGRYRRIGVRACGLDNKITCARPLRLGHLIKFSPDVPASTAFYRDVLGMKLSDKSLDVLAFLRGATGGDHHMVAFAKSSHTGLHHMSFEVAELDEIEIGAQAMIRAGYQDSFGLGRHLGGSNYFHYLRDPWGSLIEYSWNMDVIPEDDSNWEPIDAAPHEVMFVWATKPPPEDFIKNFEEHAPHV